MVMDFLSPERLAYNESWTEIDAMLDDMMSEQWRMQYADDDGRGYVFNWFCIDHVGFTYNPRRRAMGYHAVFDHYVQRLKDAGPYVHDQIQWHFHPVSFTREGHKCSNSFSFTNEHLQVLARRVIDYGWFPSSFRPGQHTERPDINLFLEQWIPFDYGNQSMEASEIDLAQKDLGAGRFGDWRRATSEWEVYHPDHGDYQLKGNMNRYIARCLNLNARIRQINQKEVDAAFQRADGGQSTILSVTDHDEREMRHHIDRFYGMVNSARDRWAEVKVRNCRAAEAMRIAADVEATEPVAFDLKLERGRFGAGPSILIDRHHFKYIGPWG